MNQILQTNSLSIRKGYSKSKNAKIAAKELYEQIHSEDEDFILVFFSGFDEVELLSKSLKHHFCDTTIIGCSGAGVICNPGYLEHGIVGASFSKNHFEIIYNRIYDLNNFKPEVWESDLNRYLGKILPVNTNREKNSLFGMMLIDSSSMHEEPLAYHISSVLGDIPLIGGSGGDDLSFDQSYVLKNEKVYHNSAIFALIQTNLPSYPFSYQNFIASETVFVVTKADPMTRTIHELNGLPAATAYSEAIGVPIEEMNNYIFANHPPVVKYRGECYVRSIQKINPDQSMTFFCAIEEGLVMRLARQTNLKERTRLLFQDIHQCIGEPQTVITFDCVYTKMAMEKSPEDYRFHEHIFAQNQCFGFNTYGEQFNSAHLNQTITGIAFGEPL